MKNINDIQTNIVLDKIPNAFLYKNNWFNNPNKEIKLYSIFKLNMFIDNYMIYLGNNIDNNNILIYVFYQFYFINNIINLDIIRFISIDMFNTLLNTSDGILFISDYNNILLNNFIEGIKNKYEH